MINIVRVSPHLLRHSRLPPSQHAAVWVGKMGGNLDNKTARVKSFGTLDTFDLGWCGLTDNWYGARTGRKVGNHGVRRRPEWPFKVFNWAWNHRHWRNWAGVKNLFHSFLKPLGWVAFGEILDAFVGFDKPAEQLVNASVVDLNNFLDGSIKFSCHRS